METLADLVARDRRSQSPALLAADRTMDYRRFCTTAWKASNYLRHLGVAGERGVVAFATPDPAPLVTFFGAALLDVSTRFVDDTADLPSAVAETNARAVLVPAEYESAYDPPGGVTVSVHGGEPSAPATDHWEGGVWSENPAFVPSSATPDSVALTTPESAVSHGQLVDAGRTVTEEFSLSASSVVGVDVSLADPRSVAAGVVAPLLVGGAVDLDGADATVTVGDGETAGIRLDSVSL